MENSGPRSVVPLRQLGVYSIGFLTLPVIARILRLAGWRVTLPFMGGKGVDGVGVWGRKPRALRALARAARMGRPVITVEDAFLRSIRPGHRSPPLGLLIDPVGVHFDASGPSRLEQILNADPAINDAEILARAVQARRFIRENGLSKYNPVPRNTGPLPAPGYVLVVDQTRGDASVVYGQADAATFKTMLDAAKAEHPDRPIVVRTHPVVAGGLKAGYLPARDDDPRVTYISAPLNPWDMLERAAAVYCVTSQLGFEAILAGLRPQVFGLPFYAGWGLSDDRQTCARRTRVLTADQLFAGAMILAPVWHDPFTKTLCSLERALHILHARATALWHVPKPVIASGMRRWKRGMMRGFLNAPVYFDPPDAALDLAHNSCRTLAVWSSRMAETLPQRAQAMGVKLLQVEDGFIRSAGLGAKLVPAQSLVADDLGIYFDPRHPSQLELLITRAATLTDLSRAQNLRAQIVAGGLSKYNLSGALPALPARDTRQRILVPGQVEGDASLLRGSLLQTNAELLAAVRAAFPQAFIIYKPHPDVLAGRRPGAVDTSVADMVLGAVSPAALFAHVDRVATATSQLGFEALLRDVPVTCFGVPFYAGWGLTDDRAMTPARRVVRPSLDQVVQAVLIDYPLYRDPVTGQPCPPEVLVERLQAGYGRQPRYLRAMAAAQRILHI